LRAQDEQHRGETMGAVANDTIQGRSIMAHPVMHFEIPAQDLERLRKFYSELFGWSIKATPQTGDYMMIDTAAKGVGINGGLITKRHPQQTVINYVMVESVAEYAEKVKRLGGQVVMPKTAVPTMGYFAVCLDPDNNQVGLWEDDPNAA
jgi:predicted enzyme related to lactoylglutathione lyase